MTKIAVYGAGAIGGYFGGRLAQAGAEVHLIARGTHLEALRKHGLRVRSIRGDFEIDLPATDDPSEIGPCDYVLFCVKSFDTEAAAARLGPLLKPETGVLTLQNGVDNEEVLAAEIGLERVIGGAAYIFATISEPGVIDDTGGPARIVFGEMGEASSGRVETLHALCTEAGIDAEVSPDIRAVLWNKLAFICAQSGMTAAVRLPIGAIREIAESRAMFIAILQEVCALAAAEGVKLPPDAVDRHVAFADSLHPDGYSSLHNDLVGGRRMELEALHGTIVRRASEHGLDVPMSRAIHSLLRPWAVRNETTD